MKSPIRWAGSKKALLPILSQYWNANPSRYIEPFCGSACFFFAVDPPEAILGDLNAELITALRTLRYQPDRVTECLSRHSISATTYYRLRALDPWQMSEVELAARFLYLNRCCFNGIYRTNRAGRFNVPYGPPKSATAFDFETLVAAAQKLKQATLLQADFEETLCKAEAGDFAYLDPPYAVASRRVFNEYHPKSFSHKDLKRLRSLLENLDRRGVAFVISYADSAEGRELVKGWNKRRVRTKRNIAGFAGARRTAYEVLGSNLELN